MRVPSSKGPVGAVLFDLDGTLIDSLADIGEAVNRTLAQLGFPSHDHERYRQFIGEGARLLVKRALPIAQEQPDEALVDRALELYQAHYAACWNEQTRPYEGMAELLERLVKLPVPVGVISNKPQAFTELCVRHFFPQIDFAVIFGQRDGIPRKPDPTAAQEAALRMQFALDACTYIGDSGVDMAFARAAGMRGVGVTWGFRSAVELRDCGARCLVGSVSELADLLGEWLPSPGLAPI